MGPNPFDTIFTKNFPHILEMIFLSLDYDSFKTCHKVSNAWSELLTSESFRRKGRSVFHREVTEEERKLKMASSKGYSKRVKSLLSSGILNVNCGENEKKDPRPLTIAALKGHKKVVKLILDAGAGRRFVRKNFLVTFGLKNGLRFHFYSETCLNYPFFNVV